MAQFHGQAVGTWLSKTGICIIIISTAPARHASKTL